MICERYRRWRLSSLYDVNPVPVEVRSRVLLIAIDLYDSTASLDLSLSVAKKIVKEVGISVVKWREVAENFSIDSAKIERMASAFEHSDRDQAIKF